MSNSQDFIFSAEIWDIIFANLDGSSVRSLCSTCKYFREKQQEIKTHQTNFSLLNSMYNIVTVDNLEIVSSGVSDNSTLKISEYMKSLKLCIDKNFPIKKLIVQRQFKSSSRQYILSSFIFSRILFCNLIEISIEYNKITWNEYLLLTNSERVEKLALEGVDVTDTKNNQVPVDMLMSRIPLAYEIDIQPCYFAPKTNLNLLLLNRKTTISKLNFVNIYGNFGSESFYSFLKNVLTPTAETLVHFRYNEINNQINENFIEELKELSINDEWYKTFHMDYPRNLNAPKPESMETLMSFINSNL